MGWLTQHRSIAHSPGGCRSKINVPAFSGSGEDSRPGGRWLTAHRTLTWQDERERKQALDSSSKSTSLIHEGSTLTTSFHPHHFPKASNPIMLGVRVSTSESGEATNIQSIAFPTGSAWEWASMPGFSCLALGSPGSFV